MTRPRGVIILALLLVGRLAVAGPEPAASECEADDDASQVVRVEWQGPKGASLGAASVVVAYPTAALVIPGKGSALPTDTRVAGPAGAMLGVSDEDGELRIVVANARGMEGGLVARIRFRRCKDAAAPPADALRCRVTDASDAHTNPLDDITCSITLE